MKIYIENAVKKYNDKKVLDIKRFVFDEGRVYALLGLNGSGKTTFAECIAGLNALTSGRIIYDNLKVDEARKKISLLLQRPYLFNTTVIENIKIGLKFKKMNNEYIDKIVSKYLPYFNVEGWIYKNSKQLSGGEAAKIALLQTVVLETEVIILDEPTASMDIESTFMAEKLIKDMAVDKRTVILITHDLLQAKRVADFILFLDDGKIIESTGVYKFFNDPSDERVRKILNV